MDDVETTIVTLPVGDNTNTTHVTTTSDHADHTGVETDEVGDLASGKVNLDSVVDSDGRVRVTDSIIEQERLARYALQVCDSYCFQYSNRNICFEVLVALRRSTKAWSND